MVFEQRLKYSLEVAHKSHSQEMKHTLSKNRTVLQQIEEIKEENKFIRWQLKVN